MIFYSATLQKVCYGVPHNPESLCFLLVFIHLPNMNYRIRIAILQLAEICYAGCLQGSERWLSGRKRRS